MKTEIILTAYSAHVESALSSIPLVEDDNTPELTDEQIAALEETEPKITPLHTAAMELLEAIKSEEPHFQTIAEENRKANWEEQETETETGLTTEINRSTALVNVRDTVEGCAEILKRHPYGFKNGSRDSKGRPGNEPFTQAENEAAEAWLMSLGHKG